jgi:tetratricopeptide (TPR) repeat protein
VARHAQDEPKLSAEQLYASGVALGKAGEHIRAEQYITAAIERGYAVDRATPELVRVCVAGSQLRTALRHAEPHLVRHPDDSGMRYLVASIHFGLEQPVRARQELVRLAELDPRHAGAHYLLGVLLRDEFGNPQQARDHFKRYLEIEPHGEHAPEAVAWMVEQPSAAQPQDNAAPASAEPGVAQ